MIKSLHLKGLQSHSDSTVEFTSGVNVILGETNAGKTALIRALQWIFQNRPLGTGLTQQGSKECIATVETDRGTASRVRKKGFNGYIVGESEFKEIGSSIPPELVSVLDIRDVNLQEQLQPHFLITQPAGQISKYVSELLGFHVTDKMVAAVKSKASALKGERSRIAEDIEAAEQEIILYAGIDRIDAMLSEIDKMDKTRQGLADSANRLSSMLSSLQSNNSDLSELVSQVAPISERISYLSEVVDSLNQKFGEYSAQSESIKGLGSSLSKIEDAKKFLSSRSDALLFVDGVIHDMSGKFDLLSKMVGRILGVQSAIEAVDGISTQISLSLRQKDALDSDIGQVKSEYVGMLEASGSCPLCFGGIDPSRISSLIEDSLS